MSTPLTKAYFDKTLNQVLQNMATKDDLGKLENKLDHKIDGVEARLSGRIHQIDNTLVNKIDGVEARLSGRIHQIDKKLVNKMDGVEARLTESISGLNHNVLQAMGAQDVILERIDGRLIVVETKMDAVLQETSTRREVRNLVRELKVGGTKLDETKIFVG